MKFVNILDEENKKIIRSGEKQFKKEDVEGKMICNKKF
jgi:hypothetical protein